MTMNKMMVIGNLGSDPEMRYTPNGQAVTSFSIATNYKYTAPDGERREETEWFRVSVFGRQAESCNQYLSKGKKVFVEGRLKSRSYETRDGQTRFSNDILANDVRFIDAGARSEDFPGGPEGGPEGGPGPVAEGEMDADNLPF
jgi:single-strand DNA-binding protein